MVRKNRCEYIYENKYDIISGIEYNLYFWVAGIPLIDHFLKW